jgi:hypothetical protein
MGIESATLELISQARAEGAAAERAKIRGLIKNMYIASNNWTEGYEKAIFEVLSLLEDGDGE